METQDLPNLIGIYSYSYTKENFIHKGNVPRGGPSSFKFRTFHSAQELTADVYFVELFILVLKGLG